MCIYILYITYYALTSLLLTCFGNANIFFAHANKAFLNLYLNLNPPPPTLVRSNVYNYNDHNYYLEAVITSAPHIASEPFPVYEFLQFIIIYNSD